MKNFMITVPILDKIHTHISRKNEGVQNAIRTAW